MEKTLSLNDYVAIVRRRAMLAVLVFLVLFALALLVVNVLPPIYRSTGKIAVESQQIPEGFVQSTISGYADERIGFINQRIMTNSRLLEIIESFKLFPDERGVQPESVLINKLRERIFLETIRDPVVPRLVAFTIGYEDRDPIVAAGVANELVNSFLDENVRTRNARASETTEFLKQEAVRLGAQVNALESRIATYKQEHGDALPEHLDLHMGMLQRAEASLRDVEREMEGLAEERRFLESQQATLRANRSAGASTDRYPTSPAQQLAALKVELLEKTAIYSAAHPDLPWLRRRIAALEREVNTQGAIQAPSSASTAYDPAIAQIASQIASANVRLVSLRDQQTELQGKVDSLQSIILRTPQVERELKARSRDYDTVVAEYNQISAKQRDAELAEKLEAEQKAERFVLLEAPQIPSVPQWPKKPKAYALGFVLAAGAGAAATWLAEFLDNSIRGPVMLSSILQHHPIGVIPVIQNTSDRRRSRRNRVRLFTITSLIPIAVLGFVHLFYKPLDVLADAILRSLPF